jgi:hypothetical protein
MAKSHLHAVPKPQNIAFDASCEFDSLKVQADAVRSIALLLASSESVETELQLAFLGIGNSLFTISRQATAASDKFMRLHAERRL